MTRVKMIGDSVLQGFHASTLDPYGGWRGRFHQHQWKTGHEPWVPTGRTTRAEFPAWGYYEIAATATYPGTIAGAIEDLDAMFPAMGDPDDLIIVSLGINDGNMNAWAFPSQPNTYTMVDQMTTLVTGIATRAPNVPILVTPLPECVGSSERLTYTTLHNLYLPRALNNARADGANVWLMPIFEQLNAHRSGLTNDWLEDGIHPTSEGYVHIAEDASAWFAAHRAELGL